MKFIFYGNYPYKGAYAVRITKVCNFFRDLGYDVSLVVPRFYSKLEDDYLGLNKDVVLVRSKHMYLFYLLKYVPISFRSLIFNIQRLLFYFFRLMDAGDNVLYFRDAVGAGLFGLFYTNAKIYYESHLVPESIVERLFERILFKRKNVVFLCTNPNICKYYELQGVSKNKLYVFPPLFREQIFDCKYDFLKDKFVIFYAGRFKEWKNVNVIFDITKPYIPKNKNVLYLIVGATSKKDFEMFKNHKNVVVLPYLPNTYIKKLMACADLFVVTANPKNKVAYFYMSPLKFYEYVWYKKPILVPKYPAFTILFKNFEEVIFY